MSCVRRGASAPAVGASTRTRDSTVSERTILAAPRDMRKPDSFARAALQAAEGGVGDDDGADQDVLHLDRDAEEADAVFEHAQDEDAKDGAADCPASPGQAGPADDHCGDDVQFQPLTRVA